MNLHQRKKESANSMHKTQNNIFLNVEMYIINNSKSSDTSEKSTTKINYATFLKNIKFVFFVYYDVLISN